MTGVREKERLRGAATFSPLVKVSEGEFEERWSNMGSEVKDRVEMWVKDK